jgi:hypothetical protein
MEHLSHFNYFGTVISYEHEYDVNNKIIVYRYAGRCGMTNRTIKIISQEKDKNDTL